MLIDNEWRNAASGETFEVINPATEEPLALVASGDKADVDAAVAAARRAFDNSEWSRMSARDRGRCLYRLATLVDKHRDELAELETLNNGKPISETKGADLPLAIDCLEYFAGLADKIEGDVIPVSGPFLNYVLREPVGVVGQIIPWNFPLLMAAWKLGPALATGCTVVLKPAEQTPLSALRLGELIVEAGFPAGVVNIVPGFGETAGQAIAVHNDIDKVAFTGSTAVGKLIMEYAARTNLKKVSLELGGKAPNIVFADADLDEAVSGAIRGIFFNQGEVCCAGSRLFIERKVHDEFLDKFQKRAESVIVGDPLDPKTQMGAQVSKAQFDRILGFIETGKKEGGRLVTGGKPAASKGYFLRPTIFADVNSEMTIAREEVFGPVVATMAFEGIEEVVKQANSTIYGLSAGIWTRDIGKAHRVARAVRAGTVWVNCFNHFDAASPFGGFKQSGIGREMGKYAVELYTQVKSVWVPLDR